MSLTNRVPISPELVNIPERLPSSPDLYHLFKCAWVVKLGIARRGPVDLRAENVMSAHERRGFGHPLEESYGEYLVENDIR